MSTTICVGGVDRCDVNGGIDGAAFEALKSAIDERLKSLRVEPVVAAVSVADERVFPYVRVTAKVTAKPTHVGESWRTSVNLSAQPVRGNGPLRRSLSIAESA